jgi:hypothetical protein
MEILLQLRSENVRLLPRGQDEVCDVASQPSCLRAAQRCRVHVEGDGRPVAGHDQAEPALKGVHGDPLGGKACLKLLESFRSLGELRCDLVEREGFLAFALADDRGRGR